MKTKNAILTMLTVLGLVACSANSRSGKASQQGPAQPQVGAAGTMDSGGCNGFEKGCLESYAVDITTLPEYQKVVRPIGQKVLLFDNTPEGLEDFKKDNVDDAFAILTKMKTWYFVPTNLDQIPSDKLGVAFATEQLALQSRKEIWVDAAKYRALPTDEARGELLLHEVVMAGYLTKYLSNSEMAKAIDAAMPNSAQIKKDNNDEISGLYDQAKPVPKFKDLSKEDYENIRGMTHFFLSSGATMTKAQYIGAMKSFGFETDGMEDVSSNEIGQKISYDGVNMLGTIELAKKSGNLPKQCLIDGQKDPVPCQVDLKISDLNQTNAKELTVEIKYQKNGNQITRTAVGTLFIAHEKGSQELMRYPNYGGHSNIYELFLTGGQNEQGDSINLKFEVSGSDQSSLKILGLSLRSLICIQSKCSIDKNNLPIEAAVADVQWTPTDLVNYFVIMKDF